MEEPKVIFQDSSLLVLDKPAGWVVNEARTTKNRLVVQRWIKENFQFPISNSESLRNGIVHRLDKETSGILIVAKTKEAYKNLQKQFKERRVKKKYLALVHAKLELQKGSIEVPLGRLPWNRERFGVVAGGRKALTHYELIDYYLKNGGDYSYLTVVPKTGRTHQIRVHMKYLGNPVVSDRFYAGRKTCRSDLEWCPRLFLHASFISFKHPKTAEIVSFESSLPSDLKGSLVFLSKNKTLLR